MKRVLLNALYFVPRNNIASYRAGCFAKYLPENGWWPTVLCQDWPKGSADFDPEFVGSLPEKIEIIRVPAFKPIGFYQRVLVRKLMPYICAHRVPILWWQSARRELLNLLQRQRFESVWGTSDPMAPLSLAEEAAGVLQCRWIADLRDSFNVQLFGSWYKRPFFAFQERRMCRRAHVVTTVSKGLAEVIAQRTGRDVRVIHNGFDPALFDVEYAPNQPVFRLIYAGKLLWPRQNPVPLFQAVLTCIQSGWIPYNQLEIAFHGSDLNQLRKDHPQFFSQLPIREHPRRTHREIIRTLKESAVLLVFAHLGERGVLTGKLFDYLGAGGAILAVPDDQGEVAELLRRTGAGLSWTRSDEIAEQLRIWFDSWRARRPLINNRNESEVARYSRREQTKTLAAILEEISSPLSV